jgi:methyl-accepting chemotaxis protein
MPAKKNNQNENSVMMDEFRLAMADFNSAMQNREDLTIRIAKRTTQIIRFSLLGMILLGVSLFFLIWILTSKMGDITTHMEDMSSDIKAMRGDFHQVAISVSSIGSDFASVRKDMGNLTASVENMQIDMTKLNSNVADMSGNIVTIRRILAQMDKSIHHMDMSITGMNKNMNIMSRGVIGMSDNINLMTRDIDAMASPMRALPFSRRYNK